ncbi:pseudouridine synthase, RluA family [Alkaliphilus metalliredigens QYMF]|uniref:Pseudouridine synthase n=1 Tax=Alkaliphilus metalliredigens (strain QYMF) TaxID=293826 RepID=A6TRX8_ALKMQ|nr:RluA family pseudouridine synthase [Alkaliphilus metalliredigens]ABR48946.1 pseudouridine synthase, RluA family [Alkaliphilus metalliredigens QYMF]
MEIQHFCVLEEDEGVRLDIYIAEQYDDLSRSYIQKVIKDNGVTVDGRPEKNRYIVKVGQVIVVSLPEAKELEVTAQNIPLDIVYEDDDLLVVNKPQDMVVHPAPGNYENTMVNALLYHCKGKLSSINGIIRPGIVHRIDKDTSGLLMVAKNNHAHQFLSEQLKDHSTTRKYHGISVGTIKEERATINAPIARHQTDRLKMAVLAGGRNAVTHIQVLNRFGDHTYMEAQLETGRTHQIRVHLGYIGHPLLGDFVYGHKKSKFNLKGQVLHAKTLGFIHPTKKTYMEFNAALPTYFEKLLRVLEENRFKGKN